MEVFLIIVCIFMVLAVLFFSMTTIVARHKERERIKEELTNVYNNERKLTVDEFFKLYNDSKMIGLNNANQCGVYVLHNKTKNMYYIGQSVRVLSRVNQHFTGKGNGDVYADYKYGSSFEITVISCKQEELNKVERHYISIFNAYANGYNKNRGNR